MEPKKLQQKIEEEEQWLRSEVIPKIIKTKKFENVEGAKISVGQIVIKFIGIEEAFMLTNCYRATVQLHFQNSKQQRSLVIKKTPQLPPEVYDSINFNALFSNESIAYSTIMPAIQNFIKQPFKIPRYYYSNMQKYCASMVLEDFGVGGWRVCKEKFDLSLEHILSAVNYLGEFHGIGFAMREVRREEFDAITSNLKEPRYDCQVSEEWLLTQKVSIIRLLKVTRELEPSVSEEFLEKLRKTLSAEEPPYGKQRLTPREPFITLCHGDYLRNNIAFKYKKEANGIETPLETMMFDLQTMQLSSPMMDLAVLLMLSAFTDVRYNNFKQIFDNYCNALTKSYETYANKKVSAYFSYDALLREFILFMPYGINISSFFLALLVEPDQIGSEEFLQKNLTEEEITEISLNRGSDVVNKELSHQVKELFDLTQKYGVDISKDIKY